MRISNSQNVQETILITVVDLQESQHTALPLKAVAWPTNAGAQNIMRFQIQIQKYTSN